MQTALTMLLRDLLEHDEGKTNDARLEAADLIEAQTARIEALEAALKACADDLEAYVNAEYPISLRGQPPAVYEPQYARDIQPVVNARAALEAKP
jgi:hypothetical protein